MRTGIYISGIGHLGLIVWILFGGLFLRSHDVPEPAVAEVSVISEEEFAALTAPAESPTFAAEPEAPTPPTPDANPDKGPAPETLPESPAAPEPPQAETPPEPAPVPETPPEPAPTPDVAPSPPQPAVPEPPAPDPGTPDADAAPDTSPKPKPSPRIAEPAPEAPPDAVIADAPSPEVTPSPDPVDDPPPVVEEPKPAEAPPEAAPEIVTEAEKPTYAPTTSMRPKTRPARLAEAAAEPETPEPATPEPPKPDAVEAALAEALGGDDGAGGEADTRPELPSGPPLTAGEKGDFALAVRKCWVVDQGSEAASVTVDVAFQLNQDGTVVASSLKMVRATEGSEAAIRAAYEAARRAVLRCGATGYDLPPEKYAQWREVEISFNPEKMRLK
ncbi:cell envelope biogenesis protein TolA [Frigidibacter sp. ROC022]|uniref:cell envelope biogenesis protein TolA n=1 Tax=Frigidibacter sp. ROC022 TaxID=2971796 RepID=UPI00215B12E7|nr:cell envelope biogenesis protein TolA [Frigidibacter sp. ROC022]MCR8725139.1 cell envelope biogenesis protein TolA [Frigidibacter sp. ROC022]